MFFDYRKVSIYFFFFFKGNSKETWPEIVGFRSIDKTSATDNALPTIAQRNSSIDQTHG